MTELLGVDPVTARYVNAVIAVLGLFLLTVGLVVEWDRLWRPWRTVIVAFLFQQIVIALAMIEAARDHSEDTQIPWRVYGFAVSLTLVVVAAIAAARAHYRPGGQEYARGIRRRDRKANRE